MSEVWPVPAGRLHAGALAAIHALCFPAGPWSADSIATLLDNHVAYGLIDPRGGMVLAQAVAGEAEILTIGIAPPSRRRGLGRILLDATMREARAREANNIFLEVEADNDAAIALYRATGFTRTGRRRAYYGPGRDALLFNRPLF